MSNVIDFMSYKKIRDAERDIEDIRVSNGLTRQEISELLELCYSMHYDPEAAEREYQESVYGVDTFDSLDTFGFTLTFEDEGKIYD